MSMNWGREYLSCSMDDLYASVVKQSISATELMNKFIIL